MKAVPDVMGMQLERAEEVLRKAKISFRIRRTAPPPGRKQTGSGQFRVIRQSSAEDAEILLICEI